MKKKVWGAVAKPKAKTTKRKTATAKELADGKPCLYRGPQVSTTTSPDPSSGIFVCQRLASRLAVVNRQLAKGPPTVWATIQYQSGPVKVAAGNCLACDIRCEKFELRPAIKTRNLIYHVCPLRANEHWRQNVSRLRQFIDCFNGRKVIAAACGTTPGHETHGPDEVRRAFDGVDCEIIELANDPILREQATFIPLLLKVQSASKTEATFYGHTKGVATLATSDHSMADAVRIQGSVRWRNAMYHHLLGRWQDAVKSLRTYACAGTTQIACSGIEPWKWSAKLVHGYWHFAGTFFWFRHDAIFGNPEWRNIPCDQYGVEAWLGGFIPLAESHSVFQPWDKYAPPPLCFYAPSSYSAEFDEPEIPPVLQLKPVGIPSTPPTWKDRAVAFVKRLTTRRPPVQEGGLKPEITRRNLIYHVCPIAHNGEWQANIQELLPHIDQFNGRRIVAVATAPPGHSLELEPAETVKREFRGCKCEWLIVPNDVERRECVSFQRMLEMIRSTRSNEATFFGHTKGVISDGPIQGCRRWRNMMYRVLLGRREQVAQGLRTHSAVGTAKITHLVKEWSFPTVTLPVQWIFAGTFFWFRHDDILGRSEAWNLLPDRYAVEGWLGNFLDPRDALSLFQPWAEVSEQRNDPWAYDPKFYGPEFD